METYYTFKRSARNWKEFAEAEKVIVSEGLSYQEAKDECKQFNDNLTDAEQEAGTKLEFTAE